MTPEQFAHMRETGIAPCGCRIEVYPAEADRGESQTCFHDEDCALTRVAEAEAQPTARGRKG